MHEQKPPHHAEAERAVVGSALLYGDAAMIHTGGIRPDEFFLIEHREAWTAIRKAEARPGGAIDLVTVGAEVKAAGAEAKFDGGWGPWAVNTAKDACIPEQVERHTLLVREAAATRKLIELATEIIARAYNGGIWDELLDRARTGIADLENTGGTTTTIHVSEAIREATDEIERRASGQKIEIISTAIATLDNILEGVKPGQLVVIAARPGQGKTSLMLNIAGANSMRRVPSLVFSLEMAARELAMRLLIWSSKKPARALRTADLDSWNALVKTAGEFDEATFWLNDRVTALDAIVNESRRWHARHVRGREDKRGIICIDYTQLVEPPRSRHQNREQEVAYITKTFKGLAKQLDVPVVTLCQLNREVSKRGGAPVLTDLRESGAIEQDADIILFPYRSIDPDDPDSQNRKGPAEIIVAKHRNGAIGSADVEWIPELMTFHCVTEAYDNLPEPTPY